MGKLVLYRGASYDEPLPLGIDLTGCTVYFTVKPEDEYEDDTDVTDSKAIIKKDIVTHDNAAGGITRLVLSSDDTDKPVGDYMCDVHVKTASNQVVIFKPQGLTIMPAVGLRS